MTDYTITNYLLALLSSIKNKNGFHFYTSFTFSITSVA